MLVEGARGRGCNTIVAVRMAFVLVASAAVAASAALAALPPLQGPIDIDRASAIRVQLPQVNAPTVFVRNVGDVNGDGRGDVGVREVQGHGGDAQRSFVVFGGGGPRTIPRTQLRATGFQIRGGPDVAAAGDLDRDGLGDLIVSDGLAGTLGVAYGRRARGMLDPRLSWRVGYAITGLGNYYPRASPGGLRDTRRHLLVGNCETLKKTGVGRAFLLPPRARGAARVYAPEVATLRITGKRFVCPIGLADVNGDGHDDAVVSDGTRSVFVVFDARRRASVELGSLGRQGFRITTSGEYVGVTLAGDINGDGRSDLFFGDWTPDTAYVVFGKTTTTTVAAARLGAAGLTIRGEPDTSFPSAAAAAGDVNGDGLGDVLVGASGALPLGDGYEGGSVYIVYGRRTGGTVNLAATGPAFTRIDGTLPMRRFGGGIGGSVASIVDLDGDHRRELAIADGYDGIVHVLLSTRLPR
jgi:hypothetical protein